MNEKICTMLVQNRAVSYDPSLHGQAGALPCERCGRWSHTLERHHRQFRSRGGLWVPSNILLLCSGCHSDATDEAPWVAGSGVNVHSYEVPAEVRVNLWHCGWVLLDDEGGYQAAHY